MQLRTPFACLFTFVACGILSAGETARKDEEKVLKLIEQKKGEGQIDDKASGDARIVAKFDSLTDKDLALFKGSKLIKTLEILDANQISDKGLGVICSMPNLERLALNQPKITSNGLIAFREMPKLTSLYLGEAKIGDAGMISFKSLTKLRQLDLFNTRITDKSLTVIKGLEHLEELNLAGTKVTDVGVKTLVGLKNLKLLDVQHTKVTEPTIKAMEKNSPELKIRR